MSVCVPLNVRLAVPVMMLPTGPEPFIVSFHAPEPLTTVLPVTWSLNCMFPLNRVDIGPSTLEPLIVPSPFQVPGTKPGFAAACVTETMQIAVAATSARMVMRRFISCSLVDWMWCLDDPPGTSALASVAPLARSGVEARHRVPLGRALRAGGRTGADRAPARRRSAWAWGRARAPGRARDREDGPPALRDRPRGGDDRGDVCRRRVGGRARVLRSRRALPSPAVGARRPSGAPGRGAARRSRAEPHAPRGPVCGRRLAARAARARRREPPAPRRRRRWPVGRRGIGGRALVRGPP